MRSAGGLGASVAMVLVAAAGCAVPAEGPDPAGPPGHPDSFTWNGCQGFLVAHWFAAGFNPGQPPAGWDDAGAAPTRVGLYGWECDRVHWDHLERGPVRFLLEVHDDMAVPAPCLVDAHRSHWTLTGLWTDDPDVAAVATEALGVPVRAVDIQHDAGDLEAWRWGGSSLNVPAGGTEKVVLPPARFFWDADGLRVLDVEADAHGSRTNGLATGTFAPPTLLSDGPQPRALTSSAYTGTTLTGSVEAACA